jgi:hypothetical protein
MNAKAKNERACVLRVQVNGGDTPCHVDSYFLKHQNLTMATQVAAAYAAKQTINNGLPQAASPKEGRGEDGQQQEAKPAGIKEWLLRVGALGNRKCL